MWSHAETCSSEGLTPPHNRKLSLRQEYVPGFLSDLVFRLCDGVPHIVDLRGSANPLSVAWFSPLHICDIRGRSHGAPIRCKSIGEPFPMWQHWAAKLQRGDWIVNEKLLEQWQLFGNGIKMIFEEKISEQEFSFMEWMTKRWPEACSSHQMPKL